MIEIKTPAEIARMRAAGRITARALQAAKEAARPGMALDELDAVAAKVIADAGADPVFLGYQPHGAPTPYPGVACISVNDAIVHGIPGRYRLRAGDLVSVDCGAKLDGWCGDAAISFTVGEASPEDADLIATTTRALEAGIAAAVPGARLGDVAHAIGSVVRSSRYGLMADHGGHGIGRQMHEAPHVPNEGRPHRGVRLQPGLVLALEPMLIAGGRDDYVTDPDGWTLRSADGTRAAHVEHTVAVTEDGPRVLTTL
ncbi:type I methionyl aminopeptidase [Actinomycetospora termitidis]|uniref:Methionine aminopeptidase n=1 Tax=Actinomycetospora termitidis TaxID=3053470 RepID=A0ABT7M1W0_9PSEU|nr:type I methionyl aminopeptidase [Actinomycetospora sp. Odt1-22]MDL5154639.1 type I methionyl aminopeptidase [Actinomycetospora sp. Odt1-22]